MGGGARDDREGAAGSLNTAPLDLVALASEIEGRLVAGSGELLLHEERYLGELRGASIALEARTYRSERSWGRSVVLRGKEIEIANLLWASEPDRAAPVLGIDLVELGSSAGVLVAADLTPTVRPGTAEHDEQLVATARIRAEGVALVNTGPLEAPYDTLFTEHHLNVRVSREEPDRAPLVRKTLLALAEAFVGFAAAPPRPALEEAARAGFRHGMEAHRGDVRVSAVLQRAFGEVLAGRVLRELMFPTSLPARAGRA